MISYKSPHYMNIFAWPPGTHMILAALSALDPKNDKKDYNKKVRRFAKYGMIYKVHGFNNEYESICPFCKLKRKNYHLLRKPRKSPQKDAQAELGPKELTHPPR